MHHTVNNATSAKPDLIDTTEMYLRTILELEEEGITPLRARIAERLEQSGPTVSQTVSRMQRDGLLTVEGDRHLELTNDGRARAVSVMRKHRLAELLLVDVIGLEYEIAHVEACRWEHVMSDSVEQKVYELLGQPTVSPYGNAIPGLSALGGADTSLAEGTTRSLAEMLERGPVTVARFSEQLQNDPSRMGQLHDAGIEPGSSITATTHSDGVRLNAASHHTVITSDTAHHIFVHTG